MPLQEPLNDRKLTAADYREPMRNGLVPSSETSLVSFRNLSTKPSADGSNVSKNKFTPGSPSSSESPNSLAIAYYQDSNLPLGFDAWTLKVIT